jgi:para-nitrobenzyl esterase
VIVQSGYLTPPEITPRGAVMGAAQSARLASGLFAADTTAASLRALRWEDIVAVQSQKLPGHFYAPVAEWPRALSLPLLIGSNADEYLMYLPSDEAGQARELSAELADYTPERAAQIRAVFARLPGSHAGRVDAVSSGKAFLCPAAKLADIVSASGRKVFAYRFERVRPGQHGLGAYHGAEIPYVFDSHDNWLAGDDQDRALSRAMQAYWVQFARSGNPNRPGLPAWPQWQNKSPRVIALDAKIETKPAPLAQLCALL